MDLEKQNRHFQNLIDAHINSNRDLVHMESNIYCNDLFGITFKIPGDWHIVSVNQYPNLFDKQTLVGEYEYYKRVLYESTDQPALITSRYDPNCDRYYGLISPVLNFSIIGKEPEYKGMNLQQYADLLDTEGLFRYNMLKWFKVTRKGSVFTCCGYNAVLYETEYLFEHLELDEGVMVEMAALNIDYGDFFLDFSMTECKSQGQVARREFEEIISSLVLKA